MDSYIGTKIVRAQAMNEKDAFDAGLVRGHSGERPGYKVIYEDGYASWSPAETFERAYRRITDAERSLVGLPSYPDQG